MLTKIREYINAPQNKRILGLILVLVILTALPLTVIISQQQQEIRQRASELISPPSPPFPPSPTPTPVILGLHLKWETANVLFEADNFYVRVDNKIYKPNNASLGVHSYPGNSTYTTLESTWFEQGIEMRFFIYFSADHNVWKVTEIRTYNGASPGNWIYYTGTGLSNKLGVPFVSEGLSKQSIDGRGYINFGRMKLQPFLKLLSPTPTPVGFCTACSADVNKDGKVNTFDLTLIRRCLNKSANFATCANRDINKNGIVDIVDMNCVARNFGKQCVR